MAKKPEKVSYGDIPKSRSKFFVQGLLEAALGGKKTAICLSAKRDRVIVTKLTLIELAKIAKTYGDNANENGAKPNTITNEHIRDVIKNYLKEPCWLSIFQETGNRPQAGHGSNSWSFELKIWSDDLQENAQKFEEAWSQKHEEKSNRSNLNLPTATEGKLIKNTSLDSDIKFSSEGLLREIAKISLDEHQRVFGLGNIERAAEISRDVHGQVISLIKQSSATLIGLQGASGTGKSTLLRQIGRDLNRNGDIAIWVSDEILKSSSSLQDLLLKALKCSHPSLNENAGIETIHIIAQSSCKLVILIDDINRSNNPSQLLARLEALARGVENKPIKFLVPLWLGQFSPKPREDKRNENIHWKTIELSTYSNSERLALSKQYDDRESEQINQLIEALNGDPFLCGIALSNRDDFSVYDSINLVQKIFNQFLKDLWIEVDQLNPRTFTLNECTKAIDKLIEFILKEGNPEPQLGAIGNTLVHKEEELLRNIAVTNRLGWIDQREDVDFWRWKHDKMRDALIGRWQEKTILVKLSPENMTTREQEYLSNLGLAEAWAFALAFLTNKKEQSVNLLVKYQPLALTELLHLHLFSEEDNLHLFSAKALRQVLIGFLSKAHESKNKNIEQQLIFERLSQTDNRILLEATKELPKHEIINIWAARFRNGDILSAIEWIDYELQRGIYLPKVGYPIFEQSVRAFEKRYSSNRYEMIKEIELLLECHQKAISTIILVGYLAWQELYLPAFQSWSNLPIEQKFIATPPIIWLLSQYDDDSAQENLEQALLFTIQIRQASDKFKKENDKGYLSQGIERIWLNWVIYTKPSIKWSVTEDAAKVWCKVINTIPDFNNFWHWLESINHPIAIENFVRLLVSKSDNDEDRINEHFWRTEMSENSHDPIKASKYSKRRYSDGTRETLVRLFKHEDDYSTRLAAFWLWKRGVVVNDLDEIQDILASDDIFDEVLEVRLKLYDRTAASFLIDKLESNPIYWCEYVPFLQDIPEVFEAFLNTLEIALEIPDSEKYFHRRNSVAKYLSTERVKELVRKKYDLLIKSPQTWLALWVSDVPEALRLVQRGMMQLNLQDWYHFFFSSDTFDDSISLRMLDSLQPVLQKHHDIKAVVAERALKRKFGEWVYENLHDSITDLRIRYYLPSKEDVHNILTEFIENSSSYSNHIEFSPELYPIRSIFQQRPELNSVFDIRVILQEWLGSNIQMDRFNLIATLVAAWGNGEDISWWMELKPVENPANITWENTLNVLNRRRWHTVNEFTIAFS